MDVARNPAALDESLGAAPHPACGHLLPRAEKNSATVGNGARLERLPVQVVEHLHRLLGGDAHVEDMVLKFIGYQYGAQNLFEIPAAAATQIIRRPADFLTAVKNHCEPGLFAAGHSIFSHR